MTDRTTNILTLTEEEVSRLFKCTKAALRRMRREGRGPRFLHVGRLVRYRISDVEEFVMQNTSGGPRIDACPKAETL